MLHEDSHSDSLPCYWLYSTNNNDRKNKTVELRIIETSDVHGSFFPYDYVSRKPQRGTLARVSSYVNRLRRQYGEALVLLDNGDILQGQPVSYFSNYVDTTEMNIAAQVMNYLSYDAATVGNHDIETGHKVYDQWINDVNCPMLGANIINTQTDNPYLKPYTIIERQGVKIAVLGMITPAIPNWLPEKLWNGLRFEEMVETARHWVEAIRQQEKPDVIIGLFHSGKEGGITTEAYCEDASQKVAQEVPGFDLIFLVMTTKNTTAG